MADDFPSRSLEKVMIRLPDGMRDRLKAEAEINKRSVNAEIVARLQKSFDPNLYGYQDYFSVAQKLTVAMSQMTEEAEKLVEHNKALARRLNETEYGAPPQDKSLVSGQQVNRRRPRKVKP